MKKKKVRGKEEIEISVKIDGKLFPVDFQCAFTSFAREAV